MKNNINQVISFFENSENGISKIDEYIIKMEGMSGTKTRHFYNNLLSLEDSRYLEIGTWKGSSVCSAMCGNKAKVLCIDDWSQFSGPKAEFLTSFEKYKGENDARFIESNCFNIDTNSIGKFNIYMYDGDHSYESHYKALTHFINCLDQTFVFIVDDWNWLQVRNGTLDAIRDLKLNVLWEKQIRLTNDNSVTKDTEGWWNGIAVFVLDKN